MKDMIVWRGCDQESLKSLATDIFRLLGKESGSPKNLERTVFFLRGVLYEGIFVPEEDRERVLRGRKSLGSVRIFLLGPYGYGIGEEPEEI